MQNRLWTTCKELFAPPLYRIKLQKKYPSCRFSRGVSVDRNSVLGKYNVLFKNVCMINSVIGDHTFVQKDSVIANSNIGKFCSIAPSVVIGPGIHPTHFISSHPSFYSSSQPLAKTFCDDDKFTPFKKVSIGSDVWLGQSCIVLDGVTIGTGAVVAAGAVVTKDIPPYAIVAGVPQVLLKYRFNEGIRNNLLESKWWERDEEWLSKHWISFRDPPSFIRAWKQDKT